MVELFLNFYLINIPTILFNLPEKEICIPIMRKGEKMTIKKNFNETERLRERENIYREK